MKLHGEYDYDCIRKTRLYYLLILRHSSARVSGGRVFCHIIINEIKFFNKVGKFIIFIFVLMIYTYELFKHSHLQVKSSVCQQSTDWIHIKFRTPQHNYYLFLLILCLQIYYWQCLGFRSPKKGMLISVLSLAGYFLKIISEFLVGQGGGGCIVFRHWMGANIWSCLIDRHLIFFFRHWRGRIILCLSVRHFLYKLLKQLNFATWNMSLKGGGFFMCLRVVNFFLHVHSKGRGWHFVSST